MSPKEHLQIVNTDRIDGDEIVVGYSDATTAVYGVEQLAELKPKKIASAGSSPGDEPESA
jgi:hypothetical protein